MLGVCSYIGAQRNAALNQRVEVLKYLGEAADIIGGEPGTTKVIDPNVARPQLELARRKILQALTLEPKNPDSLKLQGNYLQLVGKHQEAIISYQKAIEIDQGYAAAYNNMGTALKSLGKNQSAIESYRKAIELNSKDPSPYYNLGNVLRGIKKNKQAIEAYQKAIELDPQHAAAIGNLGNSLADLGMEKEAIEAYKESIRLKPNAPLYHKLGQILSKQGEIEQAEKACRECFKLDQAYAPCHFGIGSILAVTRQSDRC